MMALAVEAVEGNLATALCQLLQFLGNPSKDKKMLHPLAVVTSLKLRRLTLKFAACMPGQSLSTLRLWRNCHAWLVADHVRCCCITTLTGVPHCCAVCLPVAVDDLKASGTVLVSPCSLLNEHSK